MSIVAFTLSDEHAHVHRARTGTTFFRANPDELILVRNTTEALSVVHMWAEAHVSSTDTILCTEMEHHSNLVPWQEFAKRKGCTIEYVSVTENGELDMGDLHRKLVPGVKLVAVTQVSNSVGVVNPVREIADLARSIGAVTVVDGAQSAPHMHVDFHSLGCEFYAFSGHKMLGPMGMGGLLFRRKIREVLVHALLGGGMIDEVSLKFSSFAELPD
jgi:cysteine desulfurase/selenocysteine lyase